MDYSRAMAMGEALASSKRILVVDDEAVMRDLLKELLMQEGYQVTTAEDGKEGMYHLGQQRFNMLICDIVMPGVDGIQLLQNSKEINPECPVIMITGFPSMETAVRLVKMGASDYITKPFNVDMVKASVARLLHTNGHGTAGYGPELAEPLPAVDEDTQAYNLPLFAELLEIEVGRSELRSHQFALLVMRIERADGLGLEEGIVDQKRLGKLANSIRHRTRPGDIVGLMAPSQFAVLLPETGPEEARSIGDQMSDTAGEELELTVGLASFPQDATNAGALMKTALAAVNEADASAQMEDEP